MGHRYCENERGYRTPLQIVALYFLFGSLWILLSDFVLTLLIDSPEQYGRFQTVKGGLYVLVTAAIAYVMVRRFARRQLVVRDELRERKHVLEQRLRERDSLISEVFHRVKNNLQVVLSIVSLSSQGVVDERASARLQRIRERIHAIATVHESIFVAENLELLRCDGFLHAVVRHVKEGRDCSGVSVNLTLDENRITIDAALPIGLVVSELLTNALEHGFSGRMEGHVDILARHRSDEQGGALVITISDNGIGFSNSDRGSHPEYAVGLTLAEAMANQVAGTLRIRSRDEGVFGTEATIYSNKIDGSYCS